MNTYIFENPSRTVMVVVEAPNEDEAWRIYDLKVDVLNSMGVSFSDVPFQVTTRY